MTEIVTFYLSFNQSQNKTTVEIAKLWCVWLKVEEKVWILSQNHLYFHPSIAILNNHKQQCQFSWSAILNWLKKFRWSKISLAMSLLQTIVRKYARSKLWMFLALVATSHNLMTVQRKESRCSRLKSNKIIVVNKMHP